MATLLALTCIGSAPFLLIILGTCTLVLTFIALDLWKTVRRHFKRNLDQ